MKKRSISGQIYFICAMIIFLLIVSFLIQTQIQNASSSLSLFIIEKTDQRNRIYQSVLSMKSNMDAFQFYHDKIYWDTVVFYGSQLERDTTSFTRLNQDRHYITTYLKMLSDLAGDIAVQNDNLIGKSRAELREFASTDKEQFAKIQANIDQAVLRAKAFNIKDVQIDTQNYQDQIQLLKNQSQLAFVFLFIIIVVILILLYRMMRVILWNFQKNYANIIALSHHQWDTTDLSLTGYTEIDEGNLALNQLKTELESYLQEIHKKNELERMLSDEKIKGEQHEKQMVQLRLRELHNKINPHFLFNSLNLVGQLSLLQQPETALEIIEKISFILRYSLYFNDQITNLAKELEIIDQYLHIQKYRFGNRFRYIRNVFIDAEKIEIPSMLLQPLIENSLKHGFKQKQMLEIQLSIEEIETGIQIILRDNGDGMDDSAQKNQGGIGIHTIRERLQLIYSRDDLFEIESKKGEYTEIRILIPAASLTSDMAKEENSHD